MVAAAVKYASPPGVISTERALTTTAFGKKGRVMADANSSAHAAQLKVCSKCGEAKPPSGFTARSLKCTRCYYLENQDAIKERVRRYRHENAIAISKLRKAKYQENLEQIREARKADYHANKHKHSEANKRSHAKRKIKANAECREYYRQNKEWFKEKSRRYREANPEAIKANNQRRRAKTLGLANDFKKRDTIHALKYFDNCCAACQLPLGLVEKPHLDHWIPLAAGSSCPGTVPHNMVPLCATCNLSKSKRDPHEWCTEVFGTARAKKIARAVAVFFQTVRRV